MKKGKYKRQYPKRVVEKVDEAKSAKFQDDYDFDPLVSKVNNEYLYNVKSNPNQFNSNASKSIQKVAELAKVTPAEAVSQLASTGALLQGSDGKYGGKWFAQHESGSQPAVRSQADIPNLGGRTLQSFVEDEQADENDIYEQY